MNNRATVLTGFVAVGALTLGLAVPAHAEDDPTAEAGDALAALTNDSTSPATDVLSDVAQVPTDATGETAIDATVAGIDVTVPTDPSDPLSFASVDGDVVSIELPFADAAADAEVVSEGVVAYDNHNASTTAPVVKEDGSLQVTTVIEDVNAPTEYSYELSVPAGAVASLSEDGSVAIVGADGALVAGVAPAWAKDANGLDVPTHYLLVGSTLTQVVAHTTGEFSYPVVADPWFGVNLFAYVNRTNYSGWYKITAALSAWGRVIHTGGYLGGSGAAIFLTAGWDEIKSRQPTANSVTILQQYQCHVLGGIFEWDTWDFESNRRANGNFINWVTSRCNW